MINIKHMLFLSLISLINTELKPSQPTPPASPRNRSFSPKANNPLTLPTPSPSLGSRSNSPRGHNSFAQSISPRANDMLPSSTQAPEIKQDHFRKAVLENFILRPTTKQSYQNITTHTVYASQYGTKYYTFALQNNIPMVITAVIIAQGQYDLEYQSFNNKNLSIAENVQAAKEFIAQKISPWTCENNCCTVA